MNSVRSRNASAWLLPNDGTRTNQALIEQMRRYDRDEEVDLVVVGCGAGGSTLAQRLARRGWRVVVFDAGPFWDPDRDWVSDEAGSHKLYWNEPRVIAGKDPVPLGSNNSGRGVGGSMVHYAGYTPRFHPSDFRTEPEMAWVPTGPSPTRISGPTTADRAGAPGGRPALAVGRSAQLPALAPPRSAATARRSCAGAKPWDRGASRVPSPSSTDVSATAPIASTAAFAYRVAR